MFEKPIKIRWTGYTRGRISEYNSDFQQNVLLYL